MCVSVYIHKHTQWNISHKKNKSLPYAALWIDLEDIMLSETNTVKRQILYVITYMCNQKIR